MSNEELIAMLTTYDIPAEIELGPGMIIVDVPKYIDTNMNRLSSGSARIRALALQALVDLAQAINAQLKSD